MSCYVDTSALAKWYVPEPGSERFEAFIREREDAFISHLTVCEMRSLLARRRRSGDFGADYERKAWEAFLGDTASGALRVCGFHDGHFMAAAALIGELAQTPLRTLDALHLAVAREEGAEALASADAVMLRAGKALGLRAHDFSPAGESGG